MFDHWTFLTNHAHVLLCVDRDPAVRLRDIAQQVGITERAVQRIVAELCEAGYLTIVKDGRRNVYEIDDRKALRHPLERGRNVAVLLDALRLCDAPVEEGERSRRKTTLKRPRGGLSVSAVSGRKGGAQ